MINFYFNSYDENYKNIFGAIKKGQNVTLQVKLSVPCDVFMVLKTINGDERFKLNFNEKIGNNYFYSINIDTDSFLGPNFYYFEVENNDEKYYYGNNEDLLGGVGKLYDKKPKNLYQMYIYDIKFKVPNWYKHGVIYHVFVDRFKSSQKDLEAIDKDLTSIYGGNLEGIIDKLDYIKDLGVSILYLSPIFEAKTFHKYDIGDYELIDSDFGDLNIFNKLVSELKKRDMYLILDGVFNHCGDDSKYFNHFGNYETIGAYQSKESEYYNWFCFNEYPDDYSCWGGISELPEFNKSNASFLDFILYNPNSIIKQWLGRGIDGWRLDASDLLPDNFISEINRVVKKNNQNSVIIGELWNDATNFNYMKNNEFRLFMSGGELESVTNYPLHGLMLEFSKSNYTPDDFKKRYYSLLENFPIEYFYSTQNFLSTHDIERVLTLLDENINFLKFAILLSMTLPGVPFIYYGDEIGMTGGRDPDNRKAFAWHNINEDILSMYKQFVKLRNSYDAFKKGDIYFLDNTLPILAFKREYGDEKLLILLNNDDDVKFSANDLNLDTSEFKLMDVFSNECYNKKDIIELVNYDFKVFKII